MNPTHKIAFYENGGSITPQQRHELFGSYAFSATMGLPAARGSDPGLLKCYYLEDGVVDSFLNQQRRDAGEAGQRLECYYLTTSDREFEDGEKTSDLLEGVFNRLRGPWRRQAEDLGELTVHVFSPSMPQQTNLAR